jgi:hypothetical protein
LCVSLNEQYWLSPEISQNVRVAPEGRVDEAAETPTTAKVNEGIQLGII